MPLPRTITPADRPDYTVLPQLLPTDRQLAYARRIADDAGIKVPGAVQQDRSTLSEWIRVNAGRRRMPRVEERDRPSSKQVAYAERIARSRRREIPAECYRSRALLSRWIDSNRW